MSEQGVIVRCPHCHLPVPIVPEKAGATVQCPNGECGKPFQAVLPTAQPVAAQAPVAQLVTAQPAEPGPAATTVVEAPENEVARVHLDMMRRYPFRCAAHLLGIVGGIAAVFWTMNAGVPFWSIVFAAVTGFLAWRLMAWWLRMHSTTLMITTKRCIVETGALTKQSSEILRQHITELEVRQDMVMRMLDVGDLVITSNNGSRHQVVLMAVPHPETVADQLRVNAA
jgi:hypothetical protein